MKSDVLKRTLFAVLAVLWMIMIFLFSAQVGSSSAQISNSLGDTVKVLFPVLKYVPKIEMPGAMAVICFLVRKAGHFTAYAVLAALIYCFASTFKIKPYLKVGIAFFATVLYAVTDEFHQYFIPGRDCTFYDVCVDSLGAIFGIVVLLAIILPLIKYFKNKKKGRI